MTATTTATTTPQEAIDTGLVTQLAAIEIELQQALIEREEAIRLALVALVARQHLVLLGPPGTGKSFLFERLSQHLTDPASGNGVAYFDLLMTRFTTPEEVLGPISVTAMKADRYERLMDGYLPTAQVAFLDEVFKANSAPWSTGGGASASRCCRSSRPATRCPRATTCTPSGIGCRSGMLSPT
jgi:MoxR-like ATPase